MTSLTQRTPDHRFGSYLGVPPKFSAQSWAIYDSESKQMIACCKDLLRREVASITKMMTFYSALKLCQKYSIDPEKTFLTVSRGASKISGTSADLREGDTLSIQQLFYGMMLPSGNDAAFLLAEYFGSILRTKKYFSCDTVPKKSVNVSQETSYSTTKIH